MSVSPTKSPKPAVDTNHRAMEIRVAKSEDLPQLLEVLDKLSPFGDIDLAKSSKSIRSNFNKILNDDDYTLLVAIVDGKVVATAMLLIQTNLTHGGHPYGHIENVATLPEYRSQGIGKLLVDQLINISKSKDCYKIVLDCAEENVDFYKKSGFTRTGEIEMRYNIIS